MLREVDERYPGLETSRRIHEFTRRVITRFVEDVVAESERRLTLSIRADEIRQAGDTMICFSAAIREADASIKRFIPHMYRHPEVMRVRAQAEQIVRDLFRRFMDDPHAMPAARRLPDDEPRLARRVADYIAGMTDRYAVLEHQAGQDHPRPALTLKARQRLRI